MFRYVSIFLHHDLISLTKLTKYTCVAINRTETIDTLVIDEKESVLITKIKHVQKSVMEARLYFSVTKAMLRNMYSHTLIL